MKENKELYQKIVKACHLAYRKGYVNGSQGNLSYKLSGDRMLITSTGISLRDMTLKLFSIIDINNGSLISGPAPSRELKFHLNIYKKRPNVKTVIHTHPIECIVVFEHIKKFQMLELIKEYHDKSISIIPYILPGSQDLADKIYDLSEKSDCLILQRHGLVTFGENIVEAFNLTDLIVVQCKYELYSLILSGIDTTDSL